MGKRQGSDYYAAWWARLDDEEGETMRWVSDLDEQVKSMDLGAADIELFKLGHWRE